MSGTRITTIQKLDHNDFDQNEYFTKNSLFPMSRLLRAGANRNDSYSSGYVRSVGIIGNEELFPTEGYAFPPNKTKLTNSYRVSRDSPFSAQLNVPFVPKSEEQAIVDNSRRPFIRTERLCTRAAVNAIAVPLEGELRPLQSKIAQEAVLKERAEQLRLKEQLRVARMKDEAHWTEVEREEARSTSALLGSDAAEKRENMKNLSRLYDRELELHAQIKAKEAERDRIETEQRAEIERLDNEKDRKEKEAKRNELRERIRESQAGNTTLLERKKKIIEKVRAEDAIVQSQHAEIEAKQLEREQFMEQNRRDKDQRRERLISAQTKKLAEMKANSDERAANAESELEKRYLEEKQREEEKKLKQRMEDARSWTEFCSQKEAQLEAARRSKRERVAPEPAPGDEEEALDAALRKRRNRKCQEIQMSQAEQRKTRESQDDQERAKWATSMFFLKDEDI
jgi:hypothetical protein